MCVCVCTYLFIYLAMYLGVCTYIIYKYVSTVSAYVSTYQCMPCKYAVCMRVLCTHLCMSIYSSVRIVSYCRVVYSKL